jgi:hypothetical protein
MTYGQIKQRIETYLTENYSTGNFKIAFKNAVVPLLETNRFKRIYNLYSEIETTRYEDREMAELFLNEAIEEIKNLSIDLQLNIPGEITNVKPVPNMVYENVDNLFSKDIKKRVGAKKFLLNHLQRQESTPTFEPVNEAVLITLLTNEFNERFSNISEEERKNISKYLNLNEGDVKNEMKTKQQEVTEKLNGLISENTSKEEKNKIGQTLDELQSMEFNRYNLYRLDVLLQDLG